MSLITSSSGSNKTTTWNYLKLFFSHFFIRTKVLAGRLSYGHTVSEKRSRGQLPQRSLPPPSPPLCSAYFVLSSSDLQVLELVFYGRAAVQMFPPETKHLRESKAEEARRGRRKRRKGGSGEEDILSRSRRPDYCHIRKTTSVTPLPFKKDGKQIQAHRFQFWSPKAKAAFSAHPSLHINSLKIPAFPFHYHLSSCFSELQDFHFLLPSCVFFATLQSSRIAETSGLKFHLIHLEDPCSEKRFWTLCGPNQPPLRCDGCCKLPWKTTEEERGGWGGEGEGGGGGHGGGIGGGGGEGRGFKLVKWD